MKLDWVHRWWAMPVRLVIMLASLPLCCCAILYDLVQEIEFKREARTMSRCLYWAVTGNLKYLR